MDLIRYLRLLRKSAELIAALGIESRRVFPNAKAKLRYIVKDHKLHALPQSLMAFARTPLLSSAAKARLALEPFIPKGKDLDDESLSHFVQRRLGQEVLDYFVNPFVGGVYAGDPSRLSVAHAFPKLYRLEQRYGSLIAGTVLGARERAASASKSKLNARMFTFDDGLQVLVNALHEAVKDSVQLGRPVLAVGESGNRWRLRLAGRSGERTRCRSLLCSCAPACTYPYRCRMWTQLSSLHSLPANRARKLGIQARSGTPRSRRLRRAGSGEGRPESVGIFFSSSLFPNRAPLDHVAMTVFLGGSRNPKLCETGLAAVTQAALADVRCLLGVEGDPVFKDAAIIPRSIPQYETGFGSIRQVMEQFEQRRPGLFLAGNYRDGISAGDSMMSGLNAVERISEHLRNVKPSSSAYQHRVA